MKITYYLKYCEDKVTLINWEFNDENDCEKAYKSKALKEIMSSHPNKHLVEKFKEQLKKGIIPK